MFNINKLSFLIVLIFNLQIFGQSNNTIANFSGDPASDFNNAEKKYGGDNVDYFITFDASYLYISAKRVNGQSFNEWDHLNFYLDTDPQTTTNSGNGSTAGVIWDGNTPTLPFNADYRITIRQNGASYWIHKYTSSWADQSASDLMNWVGGTALQLRIPLSDLGDPSAVYFVAYMSYNGGFYAMNHGDYAITESAGTISGYYGGVGLKSSGAELWSTANSPITASATNPTSGGKYGEVTISDNVTVNNSEASEFEIISGGKLEIPAAYSLTVTGDFKSNGETVLNSNNTQFSSIIVQGTPTGDITYKRYVNTVGSDEWDLIGTPVGGDNYISTFLSANSGSLATNGSSPTTYAIGYYNNSSNSWTNYDSGSVVNNSTAFEPGKGYQMAHSSGGTLSFTGSIPSSSVTEPVIDNSSSGRRWNLVSNPYPSYLNLNSAADGTNNFLDINTAVGNKNIDDNFKSVYGWNPNKTGGPGYESYDFNDTEKYIAPGQGFFIAGYSTSSTDLDFTQAMQTFTGGDDFVIGDPIQYEEIYLNLYNIDLLIEQTHIRFRENTTLGLNPGYDVGNFNQNAAITTRLLEDDNGINFEHQNLPLSAMENAVIPLVINQAAGQEFRINLHTATIPDPNVYLEDVEEGTFTNLYEGDFVYTPTSDLSVVGRFFIHMSADTMSNEEVSTSMLNAYKEIDASYITIEGLATQSNETKVSLYNILGREVLSTTLNNNMGTQTISTIGLSAGIYVIELESGSDRLTKKLLIQ